jgi:hypothetical protein
VSRGRPRRVNVDAIELPPPPPPPPDDPRVRLIPLEGPEMDATLLGQRSSVYMRRRWIRQGKLRCVRLGRQTFVSEAAIADFIANGGAK